MTAKRSSGRRLVAHLVAALDQVTAALIAVNGLPNDPTDEALDEVLAIHRGVRCARKRFRECLDGLLAVANSETERRAVLAVEEAANAVGYNCADAGFRLGVLNGWVTGRVQREKRRCAGPTGHKMGETKE